MIFDNLRRLVIQRRVARHLEFHARFGLDVELEKALALMIPRLENIPRALAEVRETRRFHRRARGAFRGTKLYSCC